MPSRAWSFLANDKNRAVLGFVGSAVVVAVGAGWAAFTFLHGASAPTCGPITATNGGIAVGGNVDGTINVGPSEDQVRRAIASGIEAFCKVRMADLRLGGNRSSPWMSGEKTAQAETGATSPTTLGRNGGVTVGPDHLSIGTPLTTTLALNGDGMYRVDPSAGLTPPPSTTLALNRGVTLSPNSLGIVTPASTTLALNGDGMFRVDQIAGLTPPSTTLALNGGVTLSPNSLGIVTPASTTLALNGDMTLGSGPLGTMMPSTMVNFVASPTDSSTLSSLSNYGSINFSPAIGEIAPSPLSDVGRFRYNPTR